MEDFGVGDFAFEEGDVERFALEFIGDCELPCFAFFGSTDDGLLGIGGDFGAEVDVASEHHVGADAAEVGADGDPFVVRGFACVLEEFEIGAVRGDAGDHGLHLGFVIGVEVGLIGEDGVFRRYFFGSEVVAEE